MLTSACWPMTSSKLLLPWWRLSFDTEVRLTETAFIYSRDSTELNNRGRWTIAEYSVFLLAENIYKNQTVKLQWYPKDRNWDWQNTNFKAIICREQGETLSKRNCKWTVLQRRCFEFPVERVSLCSLQIITLKLVYQFRYCYKICSC